MEPLTAARPLALSCWRLAFPAGLRALEKGRLFGKTLLKKKTEEAGNGALRL
jgi:hypothetical protein